MSPGSVRARKHVRSRVSELDLFEKDEVLVRVALLRCGRWYCPSDVLRELVTEGGPRIVFEGYAFWDVPLG